MKSFDEVKEYLEDMSDNDLASLWNAYCEVNRADNIYYMYEFDDVMSSVEPSRLAQMIYYGEFYPCDDYFTFDGCGNLKSGYADELVDIDTLAHYIVDNKSFLYNNDLREFCLDFDEGGRICSECGKEMYAGYCIDNGLEYYCSDECLHKHYTEEEYLELYADGEGDSYWTTWYD